MENRIKSSMNFTFIVTVHIDTALNSSKKTTKKSTNNQLESFFLFRFSSKKTHLRPSYTKITNSQSQSKPSQTHNVRLQHQ